MQDSIDEAFKGPSLFACVPELEPFHMLNMESTCERLGENWEEVP